MIFFTHSFLALGCLLSSSLVLQSIPQHRQEIISECFCWCLILACTKIYYHYVSKTSRQFNSYELGPIAFGITLLCLSCSTQQQTVWSLAPLLAPALIIIEKRIDSVHENEDLGSNKADLAVAKNVGKWKIIVIWLCTELALVALLLHDPLYSLRLKSCWLFAQLLLFWGLFRRNSRPQTTKSANFVEALHTADELAHYMVAITIPLSLLWWQGVRPVSHIGVVAVLKALRWFAVLILANDSKLSTVVWAIIFCVCANAITIYPQGWQAAITVMAAIVALYRASRAFSPHLLHKVAIFVFALYPMWTYGMHNGLLPSQIGMGTVKTSLDHTLPWNGPSEGQHLPTLGSHHPVFKLAEAASARFEKIQHRQSQSLQEAAAEYQRRYSRSPPRGFDEWYSFASTNDVQWIDEYDYLTKSLEPFWQMPPKVLREYVDQALSIDGANLNTLQIKDHNATLSRGSFQHKQLVKLLEPVVHMLPDLKAALNEFDEPRVLIPHDTLHHSSTQSQQDRSHTEAQPLYISDQSKQITWNSVTLSCSPDSLARSPLMESKSNNPGPPFITNLTESQDICSWPASASRKHGFLSSPSTFKYTDRLAPIMSTAKFSTFQDIMMPSSYYFQDDIAQYNEAEDPVWEDKKDVVYWRGSGTGGHWTKGSWKMGHRQRFVNFTNSATEEIQLLKESAPGKWINHKSVMGNLKDKFKVGFSNFIQCDSDDCKAQEEYFHKVASDKNNDSNQFKILYNLDGNSFSGRYYRFLKSNSLVFMQAMFKEWHDDRLIPWLHFVPISLGMEELPEVSRYLLDEPEGRLLAARMAKESREWSRRVLRPIDLTAAYFRVFLEYARLLDDNRDTMSCCQ